MEWKELGKGLFLRNKNISWTREGSVFVNNALHWRICDENDDWKILAFDLVKEEFHYLPVSGCFPFDYRSELSVLDGCLVATCLYGMYSHIWILKEYGAKESWTCVLSCNFQIERTLVYSTSRDKILLSSNGTWFWYDLIKKKVDSS